MMHTEEPWRVDPMQSCDIQSNDGNLELACTHPDVLDVGDCPSGRIPQYNASRIVSCVNALAGIDDPEAFMLKVRELWDDNEVSGEIAAVFAEHLKGATK